MKSVFYIVAIIFVALIIIVCMVFSLFGKEIFKWLFSFREDVQSQLDDAYSEYEYEKACAEYLADHQSELEERLDYLNNHPASDDESEE